MITGQGSVGGADTPRISFKNSAITFMFVIVTSRRVVNKAKRRQCNYLNDLDFGRGELYIKKVAIQAVPVAHIKNETKHFFTTDLTTTTLSQPGLSVSTRLQRCSTAGRSVVDFIWLRQNYYPLKKMIN